MYHRIAAVQGKRPFKRPAYSISLSSRAPAVRFTPLSPARRPSAVPQPVHLANMALLDHRACHMTPGRRAAPGQPQPAALAGNSPVYGPGWKLPPLS